MNTKYLLQLILVACCSVFLLGCPYSTSVPISKMPLAPDQMFVGRWDINGSKYNITITDGLYDVKEERNGDAEPDHYKGYFTKVKDATFLNLYSPDKSSIMYDIWKVEVINNNKVVLRGMSPEIKEKFTTPEALKAYIEQHMNDKNFFDTEDGPTNMERMY